MHVSLVFAELFLGSAVGLKRAGNAVALLVQRFPMAKREMQDREWRCTADHDIIDAMKPSLSIRLFTPDDAEELTSLLHAAYAELGAMGLNYTAVDQDSSTTLARAQGGQCWIVEDETHAIVGTLTMTFPPSDKLKELTSEARAEKRAWLNQVAVSPRMQRSGIATHLWELGRRWAVAQGAVSVGVDTAIPAVHLVQLYATWGFEQRDTVHWAGKRYDSAVMTRSLEPSR